MSTPASDPSIVAILDIHAMITRFIIGAVEDVPDLRMTEQPGGIVNHPAWTLSHLNAYAGVLLGMLGEAGAAEGEMERYGFGTTPMPDAAAYAPKRELLDRFRDRNARLGVAVAATHAACFSKPAPEPYRAFSPTMGHLAITLLVAHPPHHLGQLRMWRRAAGIADTA